MELNKRAIVEKGKEDYTMNLYAGDVSDNISRMENNHLMQNDALLDKPFTYYGDGREDGLRLAYISDIHLEHHLKYYDGDEEQMIEDIVKKLYCSLEGLDRRQFIRIYAVFFCGDISDSPEMTIKFFEKFSMKVKKPIFFVLGNHEYVEFTDVQSCVEFYRERLQELNIILLHNEYMECNYSNEQVMIFGGTGFAKYDNVWNAKSLICCQNFTREDEYEETTLFETAYQSALSIAKEKKICLLCMLHYPVSACLNNVFDKEVIYFSGHNHCNEFLKEERKVLYADNQVGYENNNIAFKVATTGVLSNPYSELADGMYQTSVEEYLKFYRYLGEDVGDGTGLRRCCQNAGFYVVKSRGYYGFFVISTKKYSMGISIVNGGTTKKLTKSVDFHWICENFDIVVSKYLQVLSPLRKVQEEISRELKELGLDGKIHGLIVDIDFYHHIAFDPVEGTMKVYYASTFGLKMDLNSFDDLLESIEARGSNWIDEGECKLIRKKYVKKINEKGYLLGSAFSNNLLEVENYEGEEILQRAEQLVSRKEGMYGVSRKISSLQRLFTGRVLRDFDLRLTETEQQFSHRKKLYVDRIFMYKGIRYQIVEDKGGDIVVAEELQEDSGFKGNGIRLSGERQKFMIEELKSKIKKKNEKETYWIE